MPIHPRVPGRIAAFLILLAAASCGTDHIVRPNPPVLGHEIVFSGSTAADTILHLYVINADGTGLRRLTSGPQLEYSPRWSPDRAKVVFIRRFGAHNDSDNVAVMHSDGSGLVRLTRDFGDLSPSWSPGGTQILYQTGLMLLDIWSMNADGSNQHLLMPSDSTNNAEQVGWTKNGLILGCDFYGIDLQVPPGATSLTRILSMTVMSSAGPRMSPDDSTIAFAWWGTHAAEKTIYKVKSDGTGATQLTSGPNDWWPIWSPDGTRIAFTRDNLLWIMNADGSGVRKVPTGAITRIFLGDWK